MEQMERAPVNAPHYSSLNVVDAIHINMLLNGVTSQLAIPLELRSFIVNLCASTSF